MDDSHDLLVSQFIGLTNATSLEANQYLSASEWDLGGAVTEYFTELEEKEEATLSQQGQQDSNTSSKIPETYNGPRTLDGKPAPQSASTASPRQNPVAPPKRKGIIATLGSLNTKKTFGGQGNSQDKDDDIESGKVPRDLFTGGEKSGLAVHDPNYDLNHPKEVVRDILRNAKVNAAKSKMENSNNVTSRFRGSGQTVGGEETPSRTIPNSEQQAPESSRAQTRILHLWEDGFSIEDGPLHRFDDPQNAVNLHMIRQGRAPLNLMDVRPGQTIDVQLTKHEGNYQEPPKVYKPFSGTGNRLGSPTPTLSTQIEAPPVSSVIPAASVELDPSQPTINLRVQLADGSRLTAVFNPSHTIRHVHEFVDRASPISRTRPWILATTFPNTNHTDKDLSLDKIPELRRGGTAVQKLVYGDNKPK